MGKHNSVEATTGTLSPITEQVRDSILRLQAGAEIDRMVAQEIVGWRDLHYVKGYTYGHMTHNGWVGKSPEKNLMPMTFKFSTSVQDAWALLDILSHRKEAHATILMPIGQDATVTLFKEGRHIEASSPSAALAICKAVLLWRLLSS